MDLYDLAQFIIICTVFNLLYTGKMESAEGNRVREWELWEVRERLEIVT